MKELDHETCESFEGSWDAYGWVDFDQDTLGSMNVDLELAGFVDWRVEESKKALVDFIRDVRIRYCINEPGE